MTSWRKSRALVAFALVLIGRNAIAQQDPAAVPAADADGLAEGAVPVAGAPPKAAYARTTRDSVSIAGQDVWYLEEFDFRERPSSAVRWEKGEIAERTSWVYHDSSDVVRLSVRTGKNGSTEMEFDESGRCVRMAVVDASGVETGYRYAYDGAGRLSQSETESAKKTVRVTYAYGLDGALSERKVFTNGELSLVAAYRDDENWVETAYFDGVPILVVEYVDGARRKGKRE